MNQKIFILFTTAICILSLLGSPAISGTITDNFNDNTTNTAFWTPFVSYDSGTGSGVSIAETNQRLEVTVSASHTTGFYAGYQTVDPLVGNFDMQVDYYHLNARPTGYPYWFGTRIGMSFGWGVDQWANTHYVEYWDAAQVMFDAKNGGYSSGGSSASADYEHGRLRFVRTGDKLEGFFWDWIGSGWVSIGWGQNSVFDDPVKLDLMVWDGGVGYSPYSKDALLAFDDFSVSGPNINPENPVPEPTTMLLIGSGLVGLAGLRKKFKK